MKIAALLRFFFCGFVATALSLAAHAQTQAGQIVAAKVEGQVMRIAANGTTAPVANGDRLAESDTITTAKNSGIVLVFMNGSTVKLGPESRLAVEEFKMDPLGADLEVAKLQAEPSVSKTTLNLSYGEMVGDVKKLNTAGGSSYNIKTPVGAAGIRGTIYRIVFRPASDGKAFFTVQTSEGRVVMQGVTAQEIPVEAGKEVVVEVDVPETPGATTSPPNVVTNNLAPETQAAINNEVQVITQALQTVVIPPAPPAPAQTPPTTPPPEPPAPLPPTTPPVSVTPGAGL